MENYFTFTSLLGLRDSEGSNLPLFKDGRVRRYKSVEKMMDLIEIAGKTRPIIPNSILTLNPLDRTSSLPQPNGTTRCLSQSSTVAATSPTRADCPACWYPCL